MFRNIVLFAVIITFFYISFRDDVFNDKDLKFGISLPQTGIMKELGKDVFIGAHTYFSYANEMHLVTNKELKLITYDDKYEPELTFENIQKLLFKDKVFSLFGFVGTPTVKNILPLLDETKIPFIAPFTGASFLRDKNRDNIVNFRSSYKQEIDKTIDYLYKIKNIKKFAVFYQNDDYGEEGYVSLLEALKKRRLKLMGEGTYKRNTLSIKHAFHEIKTKQPEAIILIGAYKANALFIKKAKNDLTLKNTTFCNISFSDADEMIKELDFETNNILFSQVVPSYTNKEIDVILEYKKLMKKYYKNEPLSFISLESFLAAKTIVNALVNINGSITRNKFLNEIKSLPTKQLGDLDTKYKNTQLLNSVYLFEYKDSKFKEVLYEN